ncbi:hypothetical protein [Streptomyces tricolor]|uniref:hypothetical protein n=1 Tax=Streptomyces tricolor TaxID=68277 RepID=UPI00118080E4|nr:hypothetical protein [Streptomyces tricolor]
MVAAEGSAATTRAVVSKAAPARLALATVIRIAVRRSRSSGLEWSAIAHLHVGSVPLQAVVLLAPAVVAHVVPVPD